MNKAANNKSSIDWDGYVKDFSLKLWKERPKKPIVLTLLLLSQIFVVLKNDAILNLPLIYTVVLSILTILVIIFWVGYFRQKGNWNPFFNEVIVGLKSIIEKNRHLSDIEIQHKVNEYHASVTTGKND
ncbi:MAG: hypothetical protein K0R71_2090 [Bacillales bacterium]|jgi:hypothetical protein|nr:hypothetical protein [Bacillales bacterium]